MALRAWRFTYLLRYACSTSERRADKERECVGELRVRQVSRAAKERSSGEFFVNCKENEMDKRPVVVTTEYRGVFFGYVEDDSKLPSEITLSSARMCVYWSSATKGVLGLAATGPAKDCRVTQATPRFTAYKVTAVAECSPEAAEAWEAGPWK